MSASTISIQTSHPSFLDDEITALSLQIEEINYRDETRKGKYPVHDIPDLEVAYTNYLSEIEKHLTFLNDVKLAHSIAQAIDSDAPVIKELMQGESQAQEDRRLAVQMSNNDPELEAPPPYTEEIRNEFVEDEVVLRLAALVSTDETLYHDSEIESGPSAPYTRRQAGVLGKLSREEFECCACGEEFRFAIIVQLECEHHYCPRCLKRVIMRAVTEKDLALLPPRCCGTSISFSLIMDNLTEEELEDFQNAETEKNTRYKTYCSNSDCRRFIAPGHVRASEATCPRCKAKTCAKCKNAFHEDDCPADPDLQATLELGSIQQWQRCYSCRSLVEIDRGCNHMTCRCGFEFCYLCGVEWRQCGCAFWIERYLLERAEQVVDRAAPRNIQPAERQRRIEVVQEQLRDTDECEHRGRRKFEMIHGGRRTRFQCEMCNSSHRLFILRCRRCHLDVCMDCRLNRV
ncbi:hypothetical protein K505DRAFT_400921 [Melanomma pulvis-pyrius CBS 109.77]|uniref:RBR-type E3 ubiquitin transferase n=1 Tax=Melanomma pulvis-pyrius CBS 109.77 TaxID=1314802 RepID=A0A6A6XL16_9PLEO|nr:hypothetical protein K505DRAFT_400921 [Melanomma pulvis-pyrius CBS 109.77]